MFIRNYYPCASCTLSRQMRSVYLYPASVKTSEGTKWGYINDRGNFIMKPQFDFAMDFQSNNLAVVQVSNLQGIIDITGKYIVYPKYQSITGFSEGLAEIVDSEGFKVIDETGKILTSKAYGYIGQYKNGRAVAYNITPDGKSLYGYLDTFGNEIIPLKYLAANDFSDVRTTVQQAENLFALINLKGDVLTSYKYAYVGVPGDGLIPFKEKDNSKLGYISESGKLIIPPEFASGQSFVNGRAVVNTSESYLNNFGLIDKTGTLIIKPEFNEINVIGKDRLAVGKAKDKTKPYLGSKFAIADTAGNFLTDFIYNDVTNYNKGFASAYNDKNTFFIDMTGNIAQNLPIIQGAGTLTFVGSLIKVFVDSRLSYLNASGKVIFMQNKIIPLNSQYFILEGKYAPNKDYIVYYPKLQGLPSKAVEGTINEKLKTMSLVKPLSGDVKQDYSYSGDFSVEFFKKTLLVIELQGYNYPFGAAHGMPSEIYPNINLLTGSFYELKDLFKKNSNYISVLSNIIANQIKNDPQYSYVFPDTYKGIKPDQPFYVNEVTLNIYFEPYDIAPYAAGFPTFKIPYSQIMNIIDTNGSFWRSFH